MDQRNFKNWKDYLSTKYKIGKKDNNGDLFRIREIHWMNFGWGEDSDGHRRSVVSKQFLYRRAMLEG